MHFVVLVLLVSALIRLFGALCMYMYRMFEKRFNLHGFRQQVNAGIAYNHMHFIRDLNQSTADVESDHADELIRLGYLFFSLPQVERRRVNTMHCFARHSRIGSSFNRNQFQPILAKLMTYFPVDVHDRQRRNFFHGVLEGKRVITDFFTYQPDHHRLRNVVKAEINSATTSLTLTEDAEDCCAICTEDCPAGTTVKVLKCKHQFHSHCVVPWLVRHNSCPMCRQTVFSIIHCQYIHTTLPLVLNSNMSPTM